MVLGIPYEKVNLTPKGVTAHTLRTTHRCSPGGFRDDILSTLGFEAEITLFLK